MIEKSEIKNAIEFVFNLLIHFYLRLENRIVLSVLTKPKDEVLEVITADISPTDLVTSLHKEEKGGWNLILYKASRLISVREMDYCTVDDWVG